MREIASIAAEKGCRLLELESAGAGRFSTLRIVLERSNGEPVGVEDCEAVSREVSDLLDRSDEIPHKYTLEVSSAGLERKLYSLDDAKRFMGRRVRVRTDAPVTPERLESATRGRGALSPARNFAGRLDAVEGDRLRIVDEAEARIYNVRFAEVRAARLDFQWPDGRAGGSTTGGGTRRESGSK